MSFAVDKIIVTPMQRIVLRLTPAEPEPFQYGISLERASTGDVISDVFDGLMYRSPGLYAPENYEVTLAAFYDNPDNTQYIQISDLVQVSPKQSMATMLRQGIWDILYDAGMELDSRPVYLVNDGMCQPVVIRRSEVPDISMPWIEVGMPVMRTTRFQSASRKTEEWRVPIRLMDDIHKENADDFGRIWHLAELVQVAVDSTSNLNLGGRGVLDKAWSWRVMEDPDPERDRLSGLRMWLTVFAQRPIGAVGSRT